MMKYKKIFYLLITLFLISACSNSGNLEKNLAELDKQYGYCDNPHRDLSDYQYKICKDQERAAGEGFVFKENSMRDMLLGSIKDELGNQSFGGTSVNTHLWNGAVKTLQNYPLKNVDAVGGYLETEWIVENSNVNERCAVKINISSKELLTTAVDSKILCQNKINGEWQGSDANYDEESKQIKLTVLKHAQESFELSKLEQ